MKEDTCIAVVGLGYVGLPLAIEFGKKYPTVGYDLSFTKVSAYKNCFDTTNEVSKEAFKAAVKLEFSNDPTSIQNADFIVIAVPTPVNQAHVPDLGSLEASSMVVAKNMKKGATIVYESTVYPGATEEVCIPILERESGFIWMKDFHVGYSPERINPGDKQRTITDIVKIVSGDEQSTLNSISALYGSVISAGVYKANSIKVAEAAKVIENTQRDLNIALMNELAIIFDKIGIDTLEVLRAAESKWNFLPFRPGLVGGHCIGIDPYYLTHKAETLGYGPQVILAGRRINDGMAAYVAQQTIKQMTKNGAAINGSKVNLLGLTFKENCSDIRNSKAVDLVIELQDFGCEVLVHDPFVSSAEAQKECEISILAWDEMPPADALIVAVQHANFKQLPLNQLLSKLKPGGVFVDVKSIYSADEITSKGFRVWRL